MKFLVQFTVNERTRQLVRPEQIQNQLEIFASSIARVGFDGALPAVSVIEEGCACEICETKTGEPAALRP